MSGRILIVEDDAEMCQLVEASLASSGYTLSSCSSGEAALELLDNTEFDVLLTDHEMSGISGVELCQKALQRWPNLCVIVLTGFGSMEVAVKALRAGAYDFVTKPVALEVLNVTIDRAMSRQELKRELGSLGSARPPSSGIIGRGPAMKRLLDLVKRIAPSDATVLVQGETGTGKELVARTIHQQSQRKGPFIAINCSAMPEGLLESELFGHKQGAFTDAGRAHDGLFVQANGGTLFLDEIGDMPLGMQAKLLRALQEKCVRPLGGSRETPFDTRIVAATNRDLEQEIAEGRFREDLFYRVNVVSVEVPPLRARIEDVPQLAHHFIGRAAERNKKPALRLSPAVAECLISYDWPGNVRELENCIERAVAFACFDEITLDDLPKEVRHQELLDDDGATDIDFDASSMRQVEERYIKKVLDAMGGNKAAAAKVLGFNRRTLHRKLAGAGDLDAELEAED